MPDSVRERLAGYFGTDQHGNESQNHYTSDQFESHRASPYFSHIGLNATNGLSTTGIAHKNQLNSVSHFEVELAR